MCRKQKYRDQRKAANVLSAMLFRATCRGAMTLNTYFCAECHCWHVGNSKWALTKEQRSRNPT